MQGTIEDIVPRATASVATTFTVIARSVVRRDVAIPRYDARCEQTEIKN